MMVCYVAVPARLIGVKPTLSKRDKLAATAVSAAVGAVVCTPPYLLGRIGLLMLESHVLFIPGIIVFAVGPDAGCRGHQRGQGGQDERQIPPGAPARRPPAAGLARGQSPRRDEAGARLGTQSRIDQSDQVATIAMRRRIGAGMTDETSAGSRPADARTMILPLALAQFIASYAVSSRFIWRGRVLLTCGAPLARAGLSSVMVSHLKWRFPGVGDDAGPRSRVLAGVAVMACYLKCWAGGVGLLQDQ